LNFMASISEKDSKSTKKHINSDIRSAKVPIQAGKPSGGQLQSSSSSLINAALAYISVVVPTPKERLKRVTI